MKRDMWGRLRPEREAATGGGTWVYAGDVDAAGRLVAAEPTAIACWMLDLGARRTTATAGVRWDGDVAIDVVVVVTSRKGEIQPIASSQDLVRAVLTDFGVADLATQVEPPEGGEEMAVFEWPQG